MDILTAVSVAHMVSTAMMAGLILFVQVVHYPLMDRVGRDRFPQYQAGHTTRTAWVVIPPMLVEMTSGLWLAARPPAPDEAGLAYVGVGLLAVVWGATALLQAPAHGRLLRGFDPAVHRALVRTNWIRTVAWAARVPVAVALAL